MTGSQARWPSSESVSPPLASGGGETSSSTSRRTLPWPADCLGLIHAREIRAGSGMRDCLRETRNCCCCHLSGPEVRPLHPVQHLRSPASCQPLCFEVRLPSCKSQPGSTSCCDRVVPNGLGSGGASVQIEGCCETCSHRTAVSADMGAPRWSGGARAAAG